MFTSLPCLLILPNNGFWRAQHQITAAAYFVRDGSCGSPLNTCHFYGDLYYTKLLLNVQ